ncbi:MAG: hypothetical protein ABJE95_28945 [Byssovorax sp.]
MANHLALSSFSLSLAFLALAGCGGTTETTPTGTTSGDTSSASTTGSGGSGGAGAGGNGTTSSSVSSASSSAGTGGSSDQAMFRYVPAWSGVTAVTVIGGFGLATDWDPKQPYATLTQGADGAWTAPVSLPDGSYPYLFRVTGDIADGDPAFNRYAMDGAASSFVACPAGSPTYSMTNSNPCSQLTLPLAPPDALHHVKGVVTSDGAGIGGYLVQLDRDEPMSHHFFENRTVTAADGSFDLLSAAASVRIQVLHPTYLSKNDAQRDPVALAALLRVVSSSVQISGNTKLTPVEVAYHDYPKTLPVGMATLPTTFQISVIAGYTQARASVYGSAQAVIKSIGDPWFSSAYGTATSVPFDGVFTTMKASEMAVKPGEKYFWGTWQRGAAAPPGGVQWEGESMVFPIVWQ